MQVPAVSSRVYFPSYVFEALITIYCVLHCLRL